MLGTIIVLLVIIGLAVLDAIRTSRPSQLPCKHGVKGHCADCAKEAEIVEERRERERRWELLRRGEVKRLSQLRLKSATAYTSMGPREFEDAIAKLFRKLGFEVEQTPFVHDGGKDMIARKDNKKYVIECKRYGNRSMTGRRDLQILLSAQRDVSADAAIFVSTGRFTGPAIAYAAANQIECYDEAAFPDLVNRAYGEAQTYAFARTICLVCGKECSIRLRKSGPSAGVHLALTNGVKERHAIHTSIDLGHLKYPDLDLEAPWCQEHLVPMKKVYGYRREFWGCPEFPRCRNKSFDDNKLVLDGLQKGTQTNDISAFKESFEKATGKKFPEC
jgi:hypothetical protein